MEFDVGHGSVSRQQRVRPIRLHSPRVTLHRRLVLAFFKVSVSLKHTETVLSSSINHTMMMMMMMMMKSVSRCPSARLLVVSSAPHRSRSIPAPETYRNSVEQLDQSHDDDDEDDEERLTVSFCSTACCFLCSASLALDPST